MSKTVDKNNNSGDFNSGDLNSGNRNSGNCNSGSYNSGSRNSGNCNSGSRNSGNYNSGDRNSGNHNSGDRNSGFFNTNEPNARLFNKDSGIKLSALDIPYIHLEPTKWVSEDEMTPQEKTDNPNFYVTEGFLKTRTYHEAWAEAWSKMEDKTKQKFLNLPNFDAAIFKEITGIDITPPAPLPVSCEGKVVEIDGKKYKLVEV